MKKFAMMGLLALSLAACSKVPAGNVGIKVHLLGGDKGVDTEILSPGQYWIGYNEELFIFPTFTQNYVWTQSTHEGKPHDESISFQTMEGLTVNADIGISFAVDPKMASNVFQKYRKGVDEITDIYLRNAVRDALVSDTSTLPIDSVYGAGKADLMKRVEKTVRDEVGPIGIIVEKIYWVGELRLPANVVASLNSKIAATQMAQQRENEVAQATAEANKKIAEARGDAESIRLRAIADAEAINIKGKAIASNPSVVQLQAIERWDGKMPTYPSVHRFRKL